MREEIVKLIEDSLKKTDIKTKVDVNSLLEIPKEKSNGNYSFPCFIFAKELKLAAHKIALDIRANINKTPEFLEDIQVVGPYVNFYLNKKLIIKNLIKEISKEKEKYGKGNFGKNKTLIVEFSSPNIAKPFGIGHLRSTIIGNSISKLAEFQNYKTIKLNYLGDWGTQFGKLILGYIKFGDKKKLEKDPINHLYELYVKINNSKKFEEESREYFKKLENKDKICLDLWKRFRELSLKNFKEMYEILGVEFNEYIGESMYEEKIKEVISGLEKKKLLKESEGAKIVDLNKYNLGIVLIQKSDGATLYSTREIASAIERKEKYNFDTMIYEVGEEQKLHFNQIFKTLELMGKSWAKNCEHVEHGLYLGKDSKKLATRKGKTIFLNDILEEVKNLVKKELLKRNPKLSKTKLEEKSKKITIAAIFYGDLKNNRTNNIIFDLKKFASFEGNTGPYLQYSYARASSILRKIKKFSKFSIPKELHEKEIYLIDELNNFKKKTLEAFIQRNPSIIANYAYNLSQIFNEFYHACPVIGSKEEQFRIELIKCFRQVLKNSLSLLGIDVLEEM